MTGDGSIVDFVDLNPLFVSSPLIVCVDGESEVILIDIEVVGGVWVTVGEILRTITTETQKSAGRRSEFIRAEAPASAGAECR